ncbi:MAG TPA: hypothetical protein VJN18_11980 [Polyangiaceae bacterium]|nr:hypothetical protein [Polyangiaceae bacterium]
MSDQQPPRNLQDTKQQTALAEWKPPAPGLADPAWQGLWLTVDRLPWKALALIPAGEGAPADFTLSLAITLSHMGMAHVGGPIMVADGTQVPFNQLNAFLADVRICTEGGERVIVALSAASVNPTTPAIAKSTDGVILCVLLERMRSADAKQTIKLVGSNKFVGSIIIHPDQTTNAR